MNQKALAEFLGKALNLIGTVFFMFHDLPELIIYVPLRFTNFYVPAIAQGQSDLMFGYATNIVGSIIGLVFENTREPPNNSKVSMICLSSLFIVVLGRALWSLQIEFSWLVVAMGAVIQWVATAMIAQRPHAVPVPT